jgi:carotenoid cleavage dioxygenase-like enzyme
VDLNSDTIDFMILDAQDIEGEAVATVHIPHRTLAGFHDNWIAV